MLDRTLTTPIINNYTPFDNLNIQQLVAEITLTKPILKIQSTEITQIRPNINLKLESFIQAI